MGTQKGTLLALLLNVMIRPVMRLGKVNKYDIALQHPVISKARKCPQSAPR